MKHFQILTSKQMIARASLSACADGATEPGRKMQAQGKQQAGKGGASQPTFR
jgi:hypothetical protein